MKAILILDNENEYFYPLVDKDKSLSFLPFSLNSDLLSTIYSWINSYFAKDKIFICCKKGEEKLVISSCKEISEENIIIEPERYTYSLSMFFTSIFIENIFPDSMAIFIPVNFFNPHSLNMKNWILPLQEMVSKGWIILPTFLLNRGEKFSPYIDAGKIISNLKGVDFFLIERILKDKEVKSRIFGKQGGVTGIVSGKFKSIIEYFINTKGENIYKKLYNTLNSKDIVWRDIEDLYKSIKKDTLFDFFNFSNIENIITIFLDKKPEYIKNWSFFLNNSFINSDNNCFNGNIISNNCKNVICFNYDSEKIELDSLNNLVILKKNGNVAIKNIL